MNINQFDDVSHLIKDIANKTGTTPKQVIETVERITPASSMEALARLEREGRKPQLKVVECAAI